MKKVFVISLLLLISFGWVNAGTVDTLMLHSDVMNRDIEVVVVKPTMKEVAKKKGKSSYVAPYDVTRYPVVYLLHGASGNARTWITIKPNLPALADELGMIFVTPSVLNSWYMDSPKIKDSQYETFMTRDLIEYIDSHYNTIPSRSARALTGLSMGGHGALFLAMRHKDIYGACGSMSGGVDFRPFPLNWNLPDLLGEMSANKAVWDSHTVVENVKTLSNHELFITFDCGEDDFFLEVNKDLHMRLLGRGIDHDFTTRPGGHTRKYWKNSIDYHLLFFKKFFRGEMK